MPRLIAQNYVYRYLVVRVVWTRYIYCFSYLSSLDQAYLHAYFQPELELTDEQLLMHRRKISQHRPALRQQAGRAYAHLMRIVKGAEVEERSAAHATVGTARAVQVRAVRRAHVDTKALAKAIVASNLQQLGTTDHSDSASGRRSA